MRVRDVTTDDSTRLAELATQLGYPCAAQDILRRLPGVAGDGNFLSVAVDERDRVLGWIHAQHTTSLDSDPYGEIKALVVDERSRGQRIGELLLSAAESWARRVPCLELRVRSNVLRERAHRFYERHGYQASKTQRVFARRLAD